MPQITYSMTGDIKVRRLIGRLRGVTPLMAEEFAEKEAKTLVRYIRQFTPVRTGRLRESILPIPVKHVTGTNRWRTGAYSDNPYASYVNDGTAPHTITPKFGNKALKFTRYGVTYYTPYVKHPGTPAARMFEKGAFLYRRGIRRRFSPVFRKWKLIAGFKP